MRKALGNKCQICGSSKHLQVHHLRYDLDDVMLLCQKHHISLHHKRSKGKQIGVYLNAELYDYVKHSPSAIIQEALREYKEKTEKVEKPKNE